MLNKDAEKNLQNYAHTAYNYAIHKITENIYHVVGLGHSNATFIIAENSVILIDTLDSDVRSIKLLNEIKKVTDKVVKTMIYTHGHPDHRGGAATFKDTVTEIIAGKSKVPPLKHTERLNKVLMERTKKQFGYELNEEEVITQGLGIREGNTVHEGSYAFLNPTTFIETKVERIIDGICFEIDNAPGETDDQILIYMPKEQVLCCGDNYYACWPNLYAIRGSQYRDVATWCDSLGKLMSYPATALLAGHTNPILTHEKIQEVLGNYKSAIESIFFQTLDAMNLGFNLSQIIEKVQLPEEYRNLSYLQEFYGTIQWTVQSIFTGYLGWFDGNVTNLCKLSDATMALELLEIIGDDDRIVTKIKKALSEEQYQLALQFCDILFHSTHKQKEATTYKIQALYGLSKWSTSANARHYYIATAKNLEK